MNLQTAPVRKSIVVKAGIDKAFAVFTGSMGRWWLASHSVNPASPLAEVIMEPNPQGRWYERGKDGSECQWGHVIAWEPPHRVLLAWQLNGEWQFDPALVTELEIRFTPQGAAETRVELEHRHLERLGDHAQRARISFDGEGGWAGLLAAYAAVAAR